MPRESVIPIRSAHFSDVPYFYEICLKTGADGNDASLLFSDPWLIGHYYVAPYLFYDIHLCFAVDDETIPKGYIVGTADTITFNAWLNSDWLPHLQNRYPLSRSNDQNLSANERDLIRLLHEYNDNRSYGEWIDRYPAHMHIDILPELHGKGYGKNLVNTFVTALRARGCPGLHLGVSAANTNALSFYRKCGFVELEKKDWGFVMGMSIGNCSK